MTRRIIFFSFLILVITLLYYQVIQGAFYSQRAKANYIRIIPQQSIRGTIYDSSGNIIAHDIATYNLSIVPYQINAHTKDQFQLLVNELNIPGHKLSKFYSHQHTEMFSPVTLIKDISKKEALALKTKYKDILLIEEVPKRKYFFDYECSHIIGYVKRAAVLYDELKQYGYSPQERVGFLGIEQYYDDYLSGTAGGQLLEVDSRGNIVGLLGTKQPLKGKDITLTIDTRIQHAAFASLGSYRGVVILMDSYSGEIIAFSSNPSYSLNAMIEGIPQEGNLTPAYINRGIQATYPLASVFKPFLAVAGLEENSITPDTSFMCKGYYELGGIRFGCWDVHGPQRLRESLIHSCNVYYYMLGRKLTVQKIGKWAHRFGFGKLTQIDLPYEKRGRVPSPAWKRKETGKDWYEGDTINLSIGQGYLEATPLQAAVAMSILANGGYLVQPHLVKTIENVGAPLSRRKHLSISPVTLEVIRNILYSVVHDTEGTAHLLSELGMDVSGKTGTAQNSQEPHGWFVGFFPANKSLYTVCVFLENCGSSHEAVKVTKSFLEFLKTNKLIN